MIMEKNTQALAVGAGTALLEVSQLSKRYGGVVAVNKLDFSMARGQVVGVVGPNGAGKSTLISLLGGAIAPSEGRVVFNGEDVTRLDGATRARMGIGRTYQIPRPFLDMTVEENLLVPLYARSPFAHRGAVRRDCEELLAKTHLGDARHWRARDLPLLRRKRLEVARALALKPRLLMLDEVGGGLVDREVEELIELIHLVAPETDGIIIIEHVLQIVRECCSTTMVMNFGEKFAHGPTDVILSSDDVAAIYLGSARRDRDTAQAVAAPEAAPADHAPQAVVRPALDSVVAPCPGSRHGGLPVPLLQLKEVHAGYGQARVLHGISLDVQAGQTIAILGCNGAGKTTLSRVIAGAIRPSSGRIFFDGTETTQLPPHAISQLGAAQCMEGRKIFATLSVQENLLIAARYVPRLEQEERLATVYGLFPILAERRHYPGTAMSGGQQQMLAIGRALMARPKLVVFDEISLGLAPIVIDRLYEALAVLSKAGLTMLLVEQDVDRSLALADVAHVISHGKIALSGPADEVRRNPALRELYVGAATEPARGDVIIA
ncbi:MAG: ATP-binding cassette domain-containing protein [Pseudomonadota bacterium]